jgi:uncharacterized coiled-coil protein SlyX
MPTFTQVVPFAAAALIAAGGVGYGLREYRHASELSRQEQTMSATIGHLREQMQEMTDRLNQQSIEKPAEKPAPPVRVRRVPQARTERAGFGSSRKPVEDPRWQRVENRLADQDQKIASAKQDVTKTREDLEGKLSSTKDELNGSIGKTHDEVVLLQKRGERDYSEFTLDKSKDFHRVGPVSLALRKADTKHKRYNLELIVDDVKLEKKNVNLYEPVYLTVSDRPQPLELVVNQISKNEVRGYVSQPKYRKSELVSDAATRTKLQPAEPPR